MLTRPVRVTLLWLCLLLFPLWSASAANAAGVAWVGTANYKAAPSATGDEEIVGPFDTYDFGGERQ